MQSVRVDNVRRQVRDALVATLLEDTEMRVFILNVMLDSGLQVSKVQELYRKHVRGLVGGVGDAAEEHEEKRADGRSLFLVHDEVRCLLERMGRERVERLRWREATMRDAEEG